MTSTAAETLKGLLALRHVAIRQPKPLSRSRPDFAPRRRYDDDQDKEQR
jgi:hypothetical protein